MRQDILFVLALLPLLAACGGSGTGPVKSAGTRPAPARAALRPALRHPAPQAARVLAAPGLEGVIGANAADLARQFGTARLDVREGDARKLQYGAAACVLDIYLYPRTAGSDPQVTYVEARRPSDGKDVDRAACIAALRTPDRAR